MNHQRKTLSPHDFGKNFLVEDCQKIKIHDLIKQWKIKFKKALVRSGIEAEGVGINFTTSKTRYNGRRFWFQCPLCNKRVGILYKHPLNSQMGCRICLGLNYKKRRYKGMLEGNIYF